MSEGEFKKLGLKGPVPLDDGSKLFFNNGNAYIVHERYYTEVAKKGYDVIEIMPNKIETICDLCISKGMSLLAKDHCSLESGIKGLEGQYRIPTTGEEDYNFHCTYVYDRSPP